MAHKILETNFPFPFLDLTFVDSGLGFGLGPNVGLVNPRNAVLEEDLTSKSRYIYT